MAALNHPRLGTRLEGWKSASKRPFEKKNDGNRKCNEAMNIYNSYNSYNSNLFLLYSKTVKLNSSSIRVLVLTLSGMSVDTLLFTLLLSPAGFQKKLPG